MQVHITSLEGVETQAVLLAGLDYLIAISYVDNTEVFKTCLDYWYGGSAGQPIADCARRDRPPAALPTALEAT